MDRSPFRGFFVLRELLPSNRKEYIEQQIKYGEPMALRLNTFEYRWSDDAVFKWWIDGNHNTYRDGEVVYNICEVGEKIYLTPVWRIEYGSYTVVFNPNGGVGIMPDQTIQRNEWIELSSNNFTREHFKFLGWNTEQNGSGHPYDAGERVYNIVGKNEAITLYAQWEHDDEYGGEEPPVSDTYTVRYVEHDGTTLYEITMSVDAEGVVQCLAYKEPESCKFLGWNTKADGAGVLYARRI